ncbi:restriction endonuclease subunit S [Fibrobacter sp. UWOV1]|uniref:restriction endonuclease subunit S n=1 Tax=Fibrobacter sp. UWOV1 TaxID=1896215 RepID=UPI00093513F5|nr:restriction endonuclease subunit S [Fibrobacter sp. UWOV1]
MNWTIQKWKDVLSIVNGKNQKEVVSDDGAYPIIGSGGEIGRATNFLCEAGSTVVGRKGTINNPFFVEERFWNVDTAFGIQPGEKLNPKFLFYFCKCFNFKNLDKSTTIPSLAKTDLLNIEMPVPSLKEQRRIVNKIEELFSELDSAVETLKKTKEQLAVYRQSVLKEAFESITETSILVNLAERIFDGPFGSNLKSIDYINEGIRVVRLENLKEGWFDDSKQSFVSNEKYETIKKHTVYPSDLIMSTFISDSIKVCQMPEYIKFAVNKADCIGIRLKEDVVEKKYVLYYLLSRKAYVDLEHQIHGATRPRVNTTQIKQLEIPICSKKEQKKIVSQIESKFTICENIEKTVNDALIQADAMRQSVLKKAFEGDL